MKNRLDHLLNFEAYFFDFDGLIANTEEIHFRAYQEMLKERGFLLPLDFPSYCFWAHQKTEVFANKIYEILPPLKEMEPTWNVLREEKQSIYQKLILETTIHLMPGVEKFLSYLHKLQKPCYVVTNATEQQVIAIKDSHPILDTIKSWITREQYSEPKPSPECYIKALKVHGNINAKGIGFEDSSRGLKALVSSPLTSVLIYPSYYPKIDLTKFNHDYTFCSFDEILRELPPIVSR